MSPKIKLGLGLLGISSIVGPGTFIALQSEPAAYSINNDSEKQDYQNKFGEDFKHHLVSVKDQKNNKWWNWSFRYRWSQDSDESKDTEFKEIKDGASLKDKCSASYTKSTKDDIHKDGSETYEKSVWRYCSLEGQKPITIKESGDLENLGSTTMGKENGSTFISTINAQNDKFWQIQQKYTPEESSNKNIKDICSDLYKKEKNSISDENKSSLVFCSLKPEEYTKKKEQ